MYSRKKQFLSKRQCQVKSVRLYSFIVKNINIKPNKLRRELHNLNQYSGTLSH